MTPRLRSTALAVLATALGVLIVVPAPARVAEAPPAAPVDPAAAAAPAAAPAPVDPAAVPAAPAAVVPPAGGYTPKAGLTTSDPLGNRTQRRAIISMIIRSAANTPADGQIRIASWNIRSTAVVEALMAAHKRGVRVRVIVDQGNAVASNPNEGVDRLKAQLKRGKHSGVRRCVGSCRGTSGIPHAKFFLFSQVGRASQVVINTSANATDLAASSQWNEAYVMRGKTPIYQAFKADFEQMWLDTPVAQGYDVVKDGKLTAMFYPFSGAGTGKDPVLRELDRVECTTADPATPTAIRIAMTSWYGPRGIAIAHRVRELANQGCDVKIVYAVAGNEVLRVLRQLGPKPVRMQQIVQDFDGDGVYDRYLHAKVLTIDGTYRHAPASIVLNGSANWSPMVLDSDEAVMRIESAGLVGKYNAWINRLYAKPPVDAPSRAARRSTFGPVDAYRKIQAN